MEGCLIQTILLPVVADPPPVAAVIRAAGLARRLGARVLLLHVVSPDTPPLDFDQMQQELAPLLEGVAVTPLLRRGPIAREILAVAREERVGLIVMTRHGLWQNTSMRSFPRFLLHSVIGRVLLDAHCPVWVEPESGAPPQIRQMLCGVASLFHDRETVTQSSALATSLGAQLALFRSAVSMSIAVPGERHWLESMQQDVVTAAAQDLEALRAELAVPGEIRIGIGGFVPALLERAPQVDLIAVRRVSRDWGRDETLNALVRGASVPVLAFPGASPQRVMRSPVRALSPGLARWAAWVMLALALLSGVWLMHHTFRAVRGVDCKEQMDRCPVLNGYLETARQRGLDKPKPKTSTAN